MKHTTVLMIGDSITAGFDTEKYFPKGTFINKGVSGDSTVECLERISGDWFRTPPAVVFVCIGTNDVAQERTDQFILTNIQRIVEKIRQFGIDPTVYLTSVFPTRENAPRPNDRLRSFNVKLKQLSHDMGCSYLDLHSHYTDDEGMLKAEFTDDGLHLTEAAYKKWREVLLAILGSDGDKRTR
jgi:lysophospholipase L1-like esterase